MTQTFRAAAIVVLASLPACTGQGHDAPSPVVRVGYPGEADFVDLPSLLAHARLRLQGHALEVTHFSGSDLAIEALARGSVDVVHGSMIGAWVAISRGARIRTVMDHAANPYRLVVAPAVSMCSDLSGRRLAIAGDASVSTYLVRAFVEEECPGVTPQVLRLSESTARAAAFLAGGVDAGALELNLLHWLEGQAPGRFRMLSNFADRWPLVRTTGVHVNADFAARHPDVVRDYLRVLLETHRETAADVSLLVSEATRQFGASDRWPAIAAAYVEARTWPATGGLTDAEVEATLAFFKERGGLAAELKAATVVDRTFLLEALRAE